MSSPFKQKQEEINNYNTLTVQTNASMSSSNLGTSQQTNQQIDVKSNGPRSPISPSRSYNANYDMSPR